MLPFDVGSSSMYIKAVFVMNVPFHQSELDLKYP